MLEDIPLPEDFDVSALTSNLTQSSSVFTVLVAQKVTCAWLDNYTTARERDDEPTMARVEQALGSSRNWKALNAMDEEDGWDDSIRDYAVRVAQRAPVGAAAQELGCHN